MTLILVLCFQSIPDYLATLKHRKIHLYRRYIVNGNKYSHSEWKSQTNNSISIANRELGEIDICLLKPFNGFMGLFLLVDCNSRYLYYCPLKSKKKEQVLQALKTVLKQSGPFEAQVDLGLPICLDEPKSFSFLSLIQDFWGEYKSENLKTIEIF